MKFAIRMFFLLSFVSLKAQQELVGDYINPQNNETTLSLKRNFSFSFDEMYIDDGVLIINSVKGNWVLTNGETNLVEKGNCHNCFNCDFSSSDDNKMIKFIVSKEIIDNYTNLELIVYFKDGRKVLELSEGIYEYTIPRTEKMLEKIVLSIYDDSDSQSDTPFGNEELYTNIVYQVNNKNNSIDLAETNEINISVKKEKKKDFKNQESLFAKIKFDRDTLYMKNEISMKDYIFVREVEELEFDLPY